jgi:hypothetical protein
MNGYELTTTQQERRWARIREDARKAGSAQESRREPKQRAPLQERSSQ